MYPRPGVSPFSDAAGTQDERSKSAMIKGFLSLAAIYFLATIAVIIGVTAAITSAWGMLVAGDSIISWFSRWYRQRKSASQRLAA
jgi:hypothetical protein